MILAPINLLGIDEQGIAYISGTKMKVRQIVIEKTVWDLTPEAIQRGHEQLSMAQIYAALSYYYEHQDAIDAEIADSKREIDAMRAENPNQATRAELEQRRQGDGF